MAQARSETTSEARPLRLALNLTDEEMKAVGALASMAGYHRDMSRWVENLVRREINAKKTALTMLASAAE